jgi:uncharacterized protein (TIGR03067 family)
MTLLAACLMFVAWTAQGKEVKAKDDTAKELKKLQGTWKVVALEVDGNELSEEDRKQAPTELTIKGTKYVLKGQQDSKGTFQLGANKKFKTITTKPTDGPYKGKTIKAIYKLDGDTMTACYDITGKTRPDAFSSKDKEGYVVIKYKRKKKRDD